MYSFLTDPDQAVWQLKQVLEPSEIRHLTIGIKGAGEMATGVAWRLFRSNFRKIFMMEIPNPMAVRRQVSFCEAVYDGSITVEGVQAWVVPCPEDIPGAWEKNIIPVIVDPGWTSLTRVEPHIVIDAIMAKKNLGTRSTDASLVIGLGPGFEAGASVHMAIETNRGHNLGRVLTSGCPEPNTGIPGSINGYTVERVLRAPCAGIFRSRTAIGTLINSGEVIGTVEQQPVTARISGIVRGLIRDNTRVPERMKIGDIDPRGKKEHCTTISEKARAIGGSVLEAILNRYNH
ncbi:MAG: selenium-dependent molybdenum cofactor biosynthesis protein YqeB [Pseudomonadota bacterium]